MAARDQLNEAAPHPCPFFGHALDPGGQGEGDREATTPDIAYIRISQVGAVLRLQIGQALKPLCTGELG